MTARFVPPYPPRGSGPVPVWRGFFGERARNAVYGWSEAAFTAPYMRRKVMGYNVHMPLRPETIQHVLLDNAANYAKPDIVKRLLGPTIGEGLLSSDGALWREQRRIVAASFTPPAVDQMVPIFARAAIAATKKWDSSGPIDLAAEATATTMRIISDSLFGGDPRLTSPAAMRHIAAALEAFSEARIQALLRLPLVPMTAKGLAGRRGQTFLRETLSQVVRDRSGERAPDDFLARMIAALHERFEPAQAHALAVDNAATFYLAGHETTANAVTWTLFLLSEQPDLQEQAAEEAGNALAVSGEETDLPNRLPLLRRILEESMRLYPPVPRLDRQAVAADSLDGHDIAAGDIVSVWPWLVHRHKDLWDDADAFDIGRFTPDQRRHRFQYIPFGGGPRMCIGARFAMAEALTILAHWISRWRLSPFPGRTVRASGMVTLRPAGGLPLLVRAR
jgi:cytochrome P450